jgi:hypothetical protein
MPVKVNFPQVLAKEDTLALKSSAIKATLLPPDLSIFANLRTITDTVIRKMLKRIKATPAAA